MKITYTGRQVELAPAQLKKLEVRFGKVGKLLDGKKECEAHVVLSHERRLHRAETTINYHGHQLVGIGSDADLFTAIHGSTERLEKQAVKIRTKWRDGKRKGAARVAEVQPVVELEAEAEPEMAQRVYRVNHHERRKPMTLDEALIEMEKARDYLVYRDTETGRLNVLMRRRDGHFDLVEA